MISQSTKTIILKSTQYLIAFLFIISAIAKLYPSPYFAISTFEAKELLPMGFSQNVASYFSRTLIGGELALGVLLCQQNILKKVIIPASFLLLLIFSIHLSIDIISSGNQGNCGCFGSLLPMTPLQALIKNILAMGILIYLFKSTPHLKTDSSVWMTTSIVSLSILSIFLLAPLQKKNTVISPISSIEVKQDTVVIGQTSTPAEKKIESNPTKEITNDSVKAIVKGPNQKNSGYKHLFSDIDNGKKIMCFFAPGCEHCKETAKELTLLSQQIPNFPQLIIAFMDEEPELIPTFFEFAGSKYPYQVIDVGQFWGEIGKHKIKDTPGIIYFWNGNPMKIYDGINENKFNKKEFKSFLLTH